MGVRLASDSPGHVTRRVYDGAIGMGFKVGRVSWGREALAEIDRLLPFLPLFGATGFEPVESWGGGETSPGVFHVPYPNYNRVVDEFFALVSTEFWTDYEYTDKRVEKNLEDREYIKSASTEQIKTMLTFFVRGERFCDGHMAAMIDAGHILAILIRLVGLRRDIEAELT